MHRELRSAVLLVVRNADNINGSSTYAFAAILKTSNRKTSGSAEVDAGLGHDGASAHVIKLGGIELAVVTAISVATVVFPSGRE